jgi:hypothetical protein
MEPVEWIVLIISIVSAVVAYTNRPKPVKPKPATLEEFEMPVPDEGAAQCVVFGTCWIKDWEVLWYGNLETSKITSTSGK